MIKVRRKRLVARLWGRWGLEIATGVALLLYCIVTGFWGLGFLIAYFTGTWILYLTHKIALPGIIALFMLPVIQEKIDRLERWQKEAGEQVILVAEPFEDEIIALNTEEQLFARGVDATGNPITPPYTPYTVELKKEKGQPYDRVTLRDTGDFHRSFEVFWLRGGFQLNATDWKLKKLQNQYAQPLLGLDPKSVAQVQAWIQGPLLLAFKRMVL